MNKLSNRLIKFTRYLVNSCKKARIPLFSCKKSKRTYKQYQHITVLGLMKYLRTDYRGIIDQLELMPQLKQVIGLNHLPHFTTGNKFLKRFNRYRFDRLLEQTIRLFGTINSEPCTLAIDATGYTSNYASKYYVMRTDQRVTRRSFLYSGITVHIGNQMIASHRSWKGPGGENSRFKLLVNRASNELRIGCIVADMAYDCEANHEWTNDTIGSRCIIPVRQRPDKKVHGHYRKQLIECFDEQLYHTRSLVETVFSVIKKVFGSSLQSRSLAQQNKEAGLLCVCYNIHRCLRNCLIVVMFSTEPYSFIPL